ncbi:hypothetical protein NDU88_003133 [Pleurodeles waltl]|uniref:Uncharacterized protein n=1 Tax=Pleurodeles waltl TaxID=8319 RepID=A0AAV7TNV0_PLEWA|nr:hypothetical protein NDU88_003133 [Pleurodeles waltl]
MQACPLLLCAQGPEPWPFGNPRGGKGSEENADEESRSVSWNQRDPLAVRFLLGGGADPVMKPDLGLRLSC